MNNISTQAQGQEESTGTSVYHRDKRMNEIQKKIEENRQKMFTNRLALKKYAKTNSNPHVNETIKKYDEYYHEFKTNIKLQIRALEEIIKHLNNVLEEHESSNNDLDLDLNINVDVGDLLHRTKIQLKKDKKTIMKEIENLKKLL
jgi:adenylosuccinate synthase